MTGNENSPPYSLVDRLCYDQTRQWQSGERPTVEDFLSQHPELGENEDDLFDLIYNELQLRRALSEPLEVAEFSRRFPRYSERLQRQLRLHDAIQSMQDSSGRTGPQADDQRDSTALGLATGQRLGRYQVRRSIGAGGFGVVYLAVDTQLNRDVALKIPRVDDLTDEQRRRFHQEAEFAASLEHPHLVAVYDAGQVGEVSYIASAFCPGQNLAQYMAQRDQPCNLRTAVNVIAHLADAMHHAHQRGVVHRDLKPSNVMLTEKPCDDLPFTPQITDFGLAKLGEQRMRDTSTSLVMGTPLYMAPEQYQGRGPIGPSTDIYALGVILYEMLAGRPPYEGDNYFSVANAVIRGQVVSVRRLNPAVSRDLAAIVSHCLERDPQHRYQNCAELARDLRLAAAGKKVSIRQPTAGERFVQWANERQRIYDAGAVACWMGGLMVTWMLSACIGLYFMMQGRPEYAGVDLYGEWITSGMLIVTTVIPLIVAGAAVLKDRMWGL
ncbi:MAG: serine/threonine-protein kinase, partial [Blastopirellula sp. JB062]